ncbi:MAG: hypothetical protein H0W64_09965 [Gammaproteobacteria bacterium]|nr:hypothetical protein [Gammaproteobacteria bacterium]
MQPRRRKNIHVKSFDFDGCIFNKRFYRRKKFYESKKRDAVKVNQEFIQLLSKKLRDDFADETIFMVGSARQSKTFDDDNNHVDNGDEAAFSCFPVLNALGEEFAKYVTMPCFIDRFILADIYGNKPDGKSFTDALSNASEHSKWFWDKTKLTILYAQMHKIASEHPDDDITYHFYDDLDNILDSLYQFFKVNKDLMPKNVKLCLHHYEGDEINSKEAIQGEGDIDYNYRNNIKTMVTIAGYDLEKKYNYEDKEHYVLDDLKISDRLDTFKKKRDLQAPPDFGKNPSSKIPIKASENKQRKDKVNALANETSLAPQDEKIDPLVTNALLDYVADYIVSRVDIVDVDIKNKINKDHQVNVQMLDSKKNQKAVLLSWMSRHFRDPTLTRRKVELADQFYNEILGKTSYKEIKEKIAEYKEKNLQLECNKKSLFTSSGLDEMFFDMDCLLESERPKSVRLLS